MIALWVVLGILGTYFIVSLILLRFPTLIHKKKKDRFKCRHISHRGGAGECLENTMGAFKHALETGTDMFEIDVQLTADGQVVVSHDDNLFRSTGHDVNISDTNFEDLPLILPVLSVFFSFDDAVVKCKNDDRNIPLLRTLFETFPTVPINIDIKTYNEELIDKTVALIREFNRHELVAVGNFSSKVVNEVHKRDPDIPLIFSIQRTVAIVVTFYLGILPFIPIKESFFETPLPRIILKNPNSFANIRWILRIADWLLISPILFKHLQRRGIKVILFVINDEDDMDICYRKFNVDGIMTDYPSKLREFINTHDCDEPSTSSERKPIIRRQKSN